MTKERRQQLMDAAVKIGEEVGGPEKGIILALAALHATLEEIHEDMPWVGRGEL